MRTHFLPCSCGRKIPVETGQAGQEVRCECGDLVEVPTMKGLAELERAAAQVSARPARKRWGPKQQLLLAGLLIATTGFSLAAYTWLTRPVLHDIQLLSPAESWLLWQRLQEGLRTRQPDEKYVVDSFRRNSYWSRFGLIIATAGLAAMTASLFIPERSSRVALRRTPSRP